jgi:hypothetical protein
MTKDAFIIEGDDDVVAGDPQTIASSTKQSLLLFLTYKYCKNLFAFYTLFALDEVYLSAENDLNGSCVSTFVCCIHYKQKEKLYKKNVYQILKAA